MRIKKWFREWLFNDGDEIEIDGSVPISKMGRGRKNQLSVSSSDDFEDHRNQIRFHVQPARGGIIVTVKQYDEKRDETRSIVHLIHDDQDVAKNVADIVSMEILRS